jgi:hypothetical protein
MKKRFLSFCILICMVCSLPIFAGAVSKEDADLVLPKALTEIGEEAFCGNQSASVYLQDGVTTIGERAFADCGNLRSIRIPASVTSIAENAFEGCRADLTVYGQSRSQAQQFAKEKGFSFIPEDNGDILLPEI